MDHDFVREGGSFWNNSKDAIGAYFEFDDAKKNDKSFPKGERVWVPFRFHQRIEITKLKKNKAIPEASQTWERDGPFEPTKLGKFLDFIAADSSEAERGLWLRSYEVMILIRSTNPETPKLMYSKIQDIIKYTVHLQWDGKDAKVAVTKGVYGSETLPTQNNLAQYLKRFGYDVSDDPKDFK
jgi:hypothetical protein